MTLQASQQTGNNRIKKYGKVKVLDHYLGVNYGANQLWSAIYLGLQPNLNNCSGIIELSPRLEDGRCQCPTYKKFGRNAAAYSIECDGSYPRY